MTDALDLPAIKAARQARREFLDRLEPLRHDLYAYCRQLTGNAFDAEDLVQESLTRAFTQAAQAHSPIEKPRAWLQWYFFSPDFLTELAETLGEPVLRNGHHY